MRLSLKNVGIHRELELELSRVNVLSGPNRSGKSTVGAVFSYLLTGSLPLGAAPQSLISRGCERAEIVLSLPQASVRAVIPRDGSPSVVLYRDGRRFEAREAQSALRELFAIPTPLSARFLASHLPPEAAARAIERALHARFAVPALLERISELDPEAREHEILKRTLEGSLTVRGALGLLERRRGRIGEELEELKSGLIPERAKVNGRTVDLERTDPQRVRERLERLERERGELLARLEKKRELELELEKITRALRQKDEFERFKKLLERQERTKTEFKTLRFRLQLLSELRRTKTCPLFGGACPAAEAAQGAEHDLEDHAFEALEELERKRLELIEISRELDALKRAFEAVEVPERAQRRAREIGRLLADCFGDVSPERLKELDEKIETGRKLLELLEGYRSQAERRERIRELEDELQVAERLRKFLEGAEIPDGTGEFGKNLEKLLEVFGLSSKVRVEGARAAPLGVLSRSEYVLLQAALKLALCRTVGGGLVVLDDLDVLDRRHRGLLLREAYGSGCFCLLISSRDRPPERSSRPDVRTIFLEGRE